MKQIWFLDLKQIYLTKQSYRCIISNNIANKYVASANLKVSKAKSYFSLNQMHLPLIKYKSKKNCLKHYKNYTLDSQKGNDSVIFYELDMSTWHVSYLCTTLRCDLFLEFHMFIYSIFRFKTYLLLIIQYFKTNHSIYFFRKFALNARSIFTLNFDITLMATRGYIMGNEL